MAFPTFEKKKQGDLIASPDWNEMVDEIKRLESKKLNVAGVTAPAAPVHVAGGNWDLSTSEGDLKIGNDSHRLKIGVALGGRGAGNVRIRAHGGTNRLILGGGTKDVLTVQNKSVNVAGGNWDLSTTEGDLKIGDDKHRLKIGVAVEGAGAGDVRIRAEGGTQRLMLGSGTADALTVRDGNVGIGTTDPKALLHVEGTAQIGTTSYIRMDKNEIYSNSNSMLFLNFQSEQPVNVKGNLFVDGNLVVGGSITPGGGKTGYVTDRFRNPSGAALGKGDVVILSGSRAKLTSYGKDDNIPVPNVAASGKANDTRVCGIVAELLVEDEPDAPESVREELEKKGKKIDDGVKRLQVFTAEERENLDRKKVAAGQFGEMVTVGCFATCKVDASAGAIRVGDLLTTSATPGHAQKVADPAKATGTILGKALKGLKEGTGTIPVLVMLQ